ncbi:PAO3 [Symbiodinium necroappetens]|uniref:PAO3 protein n=1 Tax=Symbiodinium necroappetens TaxID=1628268 RepID=A0A812VEX4_9DINO|nr:PAO3 [Symbiodinium necroappetens]
MALASKTLTHFSESYVRRTVGKNLQSLLRHCWSADTSVAAAAHDIVHNHASDALPFVQQAIAESMLALMEDLVTSNMRANLKQIGPCARTLEKILRSLSKPQCQKWVSLTVKLLMDPHVTDKERLVWQLKMLWLVDDDPKRTYAEAEQQLLTVAVCDIGAFKNDLLGRAPITTIIVASFIAWSTVWYMQFFNICDEDADGRINYEDFETYCAVHGESIVNQTLKILEVMFDGVIEETGIIITATDVRNTKPHIDWQDGRAWVEGARGCILCLKVVYNSFGSPVSLRAATPNPETDRESHRKLRNSFGAWHLCVFRGIATSCHVGLRTAVHPNFSYFYACANPTPTAPTATPTPYRCRCYCYQ